MPYERIMVEFTHRRRRSMRSGSRLPSTTRTFRTNCYRDKLRRMGVPIGNHPDKIIPEWSFLGLQRLSSVWIHWTLLRRVRRRKEPPGTLRPESYYC